MPAAAAPESAGRQSGTTALKHFYVAVSNTDVKLVIMMPHCSTACSNEQHHSVLCNTGNPHRSAVGTEGERTLRDGRHMQAIPPPPPPSFLEHVPTPTLAALSAGDGSHTTLCLCSTRDALDTLVSGLLGVGSTSVTCLVRPYNTGDRHGSRLRSPAHASLPSAAVTA